MRRPEAARPPSRRDDLVQSGQMGHFVQTLYSKLNARGTSASCERSSRMRSRATRLRVLVLRDARDANHHGGAAWARPSFEHDPERLGPRGILERVGQPTRVAPALILVGVSAFLVLTALAAAAYPGGTFCDANAPGYDFWGNFFCDLTQPVTQRGVDNTRARSLAQASFVCFSLALVPFWWVHGALLGGRLGGAVRVLGLLSAAGTNLIAWLPSVVSPLLHAVSVFVAAIPGLLATLLGVTGAFARGNAGESRSSPLRFSAWLGALSLALGSADAAYYAVAIAVPGCHVLLPALQKLAALSVIGWMGTIARVGAARGARLDGPGPAVSVDQSTDS
ncbi:hypothetical protein [Sorangium cellulosum]|nr:hypothetical protein [Sorangium cellulosum]